LTISTGAARERSPGVRRETKGQDNRGDVLFKSQGGKKKGRIPLHRVRTREEIVAFRGAREKGGDVVSLIGEEEKGTAACDGRGLCHLIHRRL